MAVTAAPEESDRETLFQATITAEADVLARCDHLDLDLLPSRTTLPDGRAAVKAVLRLDQLTELVGAGATVLLERLIEPRLPADRVLTSDGARARLEQLRQSRRRRQT